MVFVLLIRSRRGWFVLRDHFLPPRVAERADVDDAARRVARLGPVIRAVVLLRHLLPPMDRFHLSLSGSYRIHTTGRDSPRAVRPACPRIRRPRGALRRVLSCP